jgi:arylsulfatase A-like enzyme
MAATAQPPPNVLIVMTDQQKAVASNLFTHGFGATPSMARLAEAGTLYDAAFTPVPTYTQATSPLRLLLFLSFFHFGGVF